MLRTVILLSYVSAFFFAVTALSGLISVFAPGRTDHSLFAILYMFLFVTNEALVLFYFIGTGKYIRTAVADYSLDGGIAEQAALFKKRLFPLLTANLFLFVVVFLSGGAVRALGIPSAVHIGLSLILLYLFFRSLPLRKRLIIANATLLKQLNRNMAERRETP